MKKSYICVIIGISIFFSHKVAAEKPTALFLIGAQPNICLYSMGNIFSSVSAIDGFYNPWALGRSVNSGVSFAQWPGFIENSKYNFVGTILPRFKIGTFNISYLNYSTGEETIEELDGTSRNVTLEEDSILSLGWGTNISESLFLGGSFKYLSSTLVDEYKDQKNMYDAGFIYHTLNDRHSFGISYRNFGNSLRYYKKTEPLPTELQLGYSFKTKLRPNYMLILGTNITKMLSDKIPAISAGFEFFPGVSFLSLRAGLMQKDDNSVYTIGTGINVSDLDFNAGYIISTTRPDDPALRFSVNYLFGPRDEYSVAKAYLNERGMDRKAFALWRNILPGEKNYDEAQKDLDFYGPKLFGSCYLRDDDGDGILKDGEEGNIVVTIKNLGKGQATGLQVELISKGFTNIAYIDIGKYEKSIDRIFPGEIVEVIFPVKAIRDIKDEQIKLKINFSEENGFAPAPLTIILKGI